MTCDNQDVLAEILKLLPVKPLLQFKSVSKGWQSLVSYPNFYFLHTQYQHQRQGINGSGPTLLLLSHGCSPSPQFQLVPLQDASTKTVLPFLDYLNVPRVKILQSCNGLLLCRTSFLVNPDDPVVDPMTMDHCSSVVNPDERSIRYFVCNPATKQFRKILNLERPGLCFCGMAFDPAQSPNYKLIHVQVFVTNIGYKYQVNVHSSETDSWGSRRDYLFENVLLRGRYEAGVFCKNSIHWFSVGATSLGFDVESERLKTMPMLMSLQIKVHTKYLKYSFCIYGS